MTLDCRGTKNKVRTDQRKQDGHIRISTWTFARRPSLLFLPCMLCIHLEAAPHRSYKFTKRTTMISLKPYAKESLFSPDLLPLKAKSGQNGFFRHRPATSLRLLSRGVSSLLWGSVANIKRTIGLQHTLRGC